MKHSRNTSVTNIYVLCIGIKTIIFLFLKTISIMNSEKAAKIQKYYDYARLAVVLFVIGTLLLLSI